VRFEDFGLSAEILRALADQGYAHPTPIQVQAIPVVLEGKDVMGAAQTGTGKTAGFSLPIIQKLQPQANTSTSPARHPVRALILTPTRELADQVAESVRNYASYTGLRSTVVFGGVDMAPQTAALRAGVEILIATPGRLLDHVQQKTVSLAQAEILILDEADRMLDMGFLPDLQRIINLLPKQRQNLMFSATFSPDIKKLAGSILKNPVTIEVARSNATADNVTQVAYKINEAEKRDAVVHIIRERELKQVLVFSNTKIGASRLARQLEQEGVKATAIHGDRSQAERMAALDAFKNGTVDVLVATDVAARGLDIAEMPCVINYDLPFNAEDYVHRIGRTGRAGASGDAISLYSDKDERLLVEIEKLIKHKIEQLSLSGLAPKRASRHDAPSEDALGRRRSGRETPDRAARAARVGAKKATDPFFDKPYEPSNEGGSEEAPKSPSTPQNPSPGKVAFLLGGGPKK